MGKTQSTQQSNENGDVKLTTIIENQQGHGDEHELQTLLLWLILVTVVLHLGIILYAAFKNREKKIALKAAKSIAALNI